MIRILRYVGRGLRRLVIGLMLVLWRLLICPRWRIRRGCRRLRCRLVILLMVNRWLSRVVVLCLWMEMVMWMLLCLGCSAVITLA